MRGGFIIHQANQPTVTMSKNFVDEGKVIKCILTYIHNFIVIFKIQFHRLCVLSYPLEGQWN